MASVWGASSHGDSPADTHRADADSRADTHRADAVWTSERRIAADGQAYTMQEYQEYYGMWWLERWQTAGVVQPGEDGPAGAGHLGEWHEAPFFTRTLRLQELPDRFRVATDLRQAIDASYGALFEYLPLLCSTFCNFDVAERLHEAGAVVVAEKVIKIPDGNRPPLCRVDFFCYHAGGAVVRCHPGRSKATTMTPHRMLPGSVLFRKATAWEVGVGAALHAEPPGVVRDAQRALPAAPGPGGDIADALQLGAIVATRQDMDEVCKYDVMMLSWKVVREKLSALETDDEDTVDWSNGVSFPWWVWLANTGVLRDVVNEGVRAVEVEVKRGVKSVVVTSVRGSFWLSADPTYGKLQVWPVPRKCDET